MIDAGKVLEVSKILEKVKLVKTKFTKNEGLNELYMDIYKNYYISDLKLKFERFQPLITEIAQNQGKSIRMEIVGDEVKVDNSPYSDFINSTIHIFRNIIDHGIESEDERLEKNKLKEGHIKIRFKNQGNSINIFIIDDGRGIDPEEIKKVSVKKGLASEA